MEGSLSASHSGRILASAFFSGAVFIPCLTTKLFAYKNKQQGFMYFGSILVTLFYRQISPAKWMILSSLLSVTGYGVLLLFRPLGRSWLTLLQVTMGILAGLGTGFAYGIIIITPQFWLEKKRKKLNPYLFLGYPGFLLLSVTLGNYLCDIFSWYGAVIVITGVFLNQLILGTIFIRHDSEPACQNGEEDDGKLWIRESLIEIRNALANKIRVQHNFWFNFEPEF